MSKFNVEVKDKTINLGLDTNQDGENVLTAKVHMDEALSELLKKDGVSLEGAKLVAFKFNLTKLSLTIDTDRDGEPMLELEIDLGEALEESGLLGKIGG